MVGVVDYVVRFTDGPLIEKICTQIKNTTPDRRQSKILSTVDRDLNQYKVVAPLFGAAYAAPNIGTTILYYFSVLMSPLEFYH